MRYVAVLALLIACTPAATTAEPAIASYTVRLVISSDDTAVATVVVQIDGATPGMVAIPLGFGGVTGLTVVDGPAGVSATAVAVDGQSELRLSFPVGVLPAAHVTVQFPVAQPFLRTTPGPGERRTLPADVRLFRHAFLNTKPAPIARYRFEAVFPQGVQAHAVREALPKLRKAEPGPRARLASVDGRRGAWLEVTRLAQGDGASLQIELVPEGRSWAWLIAGLALSVLYLVYFRDLVGRRAQ